MNDDFGSSVNCFIFYFYASRLVRCSIGFSGFIVLDMFMFILCLWYSVLIVCYILILTLYRLYCIW